MFVGLTRCKWTGTTESMNRTLTSHMEKNVQVTSKVWEILFRRRIWEYQKGKVSFFTRRSERKSGYSGGRMGFLGVLIIERALASRRLTPTVVQL